MNVRSQHLIYIHYSYVQAIQGMCKIREKGIELLKFTQVVIESISEIFYNMFYMPGALAILVCSQVCIGVIKTRGPCISVSNKQETKDGPYLEI